MNEKRGQAASRIHGNMDIVVFLDDDLDIIDPEIFKILITSFVDSQTVGATVNINIQSFIGEEFELPLLKRDSKIFKFISWLTSAKLPPRGKSGRLGIVGGRPDQSQNTEFFSGACMTFRREIIPNIIPYSLISLYERKLGKGEDKVISMFANRFGTLKYYHKICLMHPPNDSSYYKNVQDFFKRVMYSRLYLSKVYAKVFSHSLVKEILIYYWFGIWRLMIATITYFAKPSKTRKDKVLGILNGLWLSLTLPHKPEKITPGINWDVEIQKDLARASNS